MMDTDSARSNNTNKRSPGEFTSSLSASAENQIAEAKRRAQAYAQSLQTAREQEAKALQTLEERQARWIYDSEEKAVRIEQLERELESAVEVLQQQRRERDRETDSQREREMVFSTAAPVVTAPLPPILSQPHTQTQTNFLSSPPVPILSSADIHSDFQQVLASAATHSALPGAVNGGGSSLPTRFSTNQINTHVHTSTSAFAPMSVAPAASVSAFSASAAPTITPLPIANLAQAFSTPAPTNAMMSNTSNAAAFSSASSSSSSPRAYGGISSTHSKMNSFPVTNTATNNSSLLFPAAPKSPERSPSLSSSSPEMWQDLLNKYKEQLQNARSEAAQLAKDKKALTERIVEMSNDSSRLREEKDNLRVKLADIEAKLQFRTSQVRDLEHEKIRREESDAEQRLKLQSYQQESNSHVAQISILENENKLALQTITSLDQNLNIVKSLNANLEAKVIELQNKLDDKEQKLKEMEQRFQETEDHYTKELFEMKHAFNQLQLQLTKSELMNASRQPPTASAFSSQFPSPSPYAPTPTPTPPAPTDLRSAARAALAMESPMSEQANSNSERFFRNDFSYGGNEQRHENEYFASTYNQERDPRLYHEETMEQTHAPSQPLSISVSPNPSPALSQPVIRNYSPVPASTTSAPSTTGVSAPPSSGKEARVSPTRERQSVKEKANNNITFEQDGDQSLAEIDLAPRPRSRPPSASPSRPPRSQASAHHSKSSQQRKHHVINDSQYDDDHASFLSHSISHDFPITTLHHSPSTSHIKAAESAVKKVVVRVNSHEKEKEKTPSSSAASTPHHAHAHSAAPSTVKRKSSLTATEKGKEKEKEKVKKKIESSASKHMMTIRSVSPNPQKVPSSATRTSGAERSLHVPKHVVTPSTVLHSHRHVVTPKSSSTTATASLSKTTSRTTRSKSVDSVARKKHNVTTFF